MKLVWSAEELLEEALVRRARKERAKIPPIRRGNPVAWALSPNSRSTGCTRAFPRDAPISRRPVLAHLAEQLGILASVIADYGWDWSQRAVAIIGSSLSGSTFWRLIRRRKAAFQTRGCRESFSNGNPGAAESEERIDQWFLQAKRERPGGYRLDRIINAARQTLRRTRFPNGDGAARSAGAP